MIRRTVSRNWFLITVMFFVAGSCLNQSTAQLPLADPIPGDISQTSWSVGLADTITIPNSSGSSRPRLEFLTGGGAPGQAYVIDQRGKIYSFDPTATNPSATLFMNLSTAVPNFKDGGQQGVRGVAFHPDFNNAGTAGFRKFYTSHSRTISSSGIGGPESFGSGSFSNHRSVVGEWTVNSNGSVNTSSYRELFRVRQPMGDHNIGQIGFNPNAASGQSDYGKLYIAMGDGGSNAFPQTETDPFEHGQELDELFGSILRIDPIENGSDPYSIATDNALRVSTDVSNPRNLVWANGLRNPHRFSFDTGGSQGMYIFDIGQGNIEEVNLGANGANYGWADREGTFVDTNQTFVSNINLLDPLPGNHATDIYTYPVAQYDHQNSSVGSSSPAEPGNGAIAGGVVYRGSDFPQLNGMLFFGDFANNHGPVFAVHTDDLVQQEDFSNINNLNGGNIAPFEEVQLTVNGAQKTMLQIIRDASGNQNLGRTDIRFNIGPDGELYILNKRDGRVRRLVSTTLPQLLACDLDADGDCDHADIDILYTSSPSSTDIATWLSQASDPANPYKTSSGGTTADVYILGDANLDGDVDSTDLGLVLNDFGSTTGVGWGQGDLNADGDVDSTDLGLVLNNFGATSAAAVPEPDMTYLFLPVFCAALLNRIRRMRR